MTFETEFNPHFSIDKDYQTNAPTYYDYLAETNEAMRTLYTDIETALNTDLAKDIVLAVDATSQKLGKITKLETSPRRWQYTIQLLQDTGKSGNLECTDNTITIRKVDEDHVRVACNVPEVLKGLTMTTKGEGLKVNRTGDTISYEVDFSKVQKKIKSSDSVKINDTNNTLSVNTDVIQGKLTAGENIRISNGNVISAVGDANVATKQATIETTRDTHIFDDQAVGVTAEGNYVSVSPDKLTKEGVYFINGDNSRVNIADKEKHWYGTVETPTAERGWLIVHSVYGGDACMQEFIPWHGKGRFWRTGTYIFQDSDDWKKYDTEYNFGGFEKNQLAPQATIGEVYYWSDWQTTFTFNINGEDDSIINQLTANLQKTLHKDNWKFKDAGRVSHRNTALLNNAYAGTVSAQRMSNNKNINVTSQIAFGSCYSPVEAISCEGKKDQIFTVNGNDSEWEYKSYDMLRGTGLQKWDISNVTDSKSTQQRLGIGVDIAKSSKYLYVATTERVKRINTLQQTTEDLYNHVGGGKTEWGYTRPNGSTAKPQGVAIDNINDNIVYLLLNDVKLNNTNTCTIDNGGDKMIMYKVDYSSSSSSPNVTKLWERTKPNGMFSGMTYYNGIFYIDFTSRKGSDNTPQLGKCFMFDQQGFNVETVEFTGSTTEVGEGKQDQVKQYDGTNTWLTGVGVMLKPVTYNEKSPREYNVDGLAKTTVPYIVHSIYKEGDANMVIKHRVYEDLIEPYTEYSYDEMRNDVKPEYTNGQLKKPVTSGWNMFVYNCENVGGWYKLESWGNTTYFVDEDGSVALLGTSNSYTTITFKCTKKGKVVTAVPSTDTPHFYLQGKSKEESGTFSINNEFAVMDGVDTETGNTENITWPNTDNTTNDLDGNVTADTDEGISTLEE